MILSLLTSVFLLAAHAEPQSNVSEPPSGPEDIVLNYAPDMSGELLAADRDMLARYAEQADTVVVGRVVALRPDWDTAGQSEIVTVLIEQRFRGDVIGITEFRVPLLQNAVGRQSSLIEGYRLLLFLDETSNVVEGDALFFVEGGHAWRARRDDIFLRPSADRAWANEMDPIQDYIALSMDEVRQAAIVQSDDRSGKRR